MGLVASIWATDVRAAIVMAGRIEVGAVWINVHLIGFCETPWGGCRQSGWGMEVSTMALGEYAHTEYVHVDLRARPSSLATAC
jgi:acyl-CoA reductase-like NAD-dependent aldehyde dehydrogenase